MIDMIAIILLAFGSITILFARRNEKLSHVALLALWTGAVLTLVGLL